MDFKTHTIDDRHWLVREGGWLVNEGSRYVRGRERPDFKAQQPRVCGEIEADAEKRMIPMMALDSVRDQARSAVLERGSVPSAFL